MTTRSGSGPRPDTERTLEETQLVEQARAGSTAAFTELVRIHQAAVRAYVSRYVRGSEAVDDLAQEVFLGSFRSLRTYRGEATFRPWLFAIARHHVADYLRQQIRRRGREVLSSAFFHWQAELVETDEHRFGIYDDELAALAACLERLPARSADLIDAFYFRAESAAAIAQRLGKKEGAVRMLLLRIRQALHTCVRQRLKAAQEVR